METESFDTLFESLTSIIKKNPNLPNLRITPPSNLPMPVQADGVAILNSLNPLGITSLLEGSLVDSLKILSRQGLVGWREVSDQ